MTIIEYKVKVHENGDRFWYVNDQLHREDGPAVEHALGDKFWYRNGKLHREGGPACEYADGGRSWYIQGDKLTKAEFLKRTQPAKEMTVAEIEALLGHRVKVVK